MDKKLLIRVGAVIMTIFLLLGLIVPALAAPEKGVVIKLHYNRPDGDYTDWSVWFWNFGAEGVDIPFAEENGEIIGFAMGRMEQFWDLVAYNLVEILIAKSHQGNGYGTAMMTELENRVKALGVSMVQLQSIADEQHERFYGRLGYYNSENLRLKGKFL